MERWSKVYRIFESLKGGNFVIRKLESVRSKFVLLDVSVQLIQHLGARVQAFKRLKVRIYGNACFLSLLTFSILLLRNRLTTLYYNQKKLITFERPIWKNCTLNSRYRLVFLRTFFLISFSISIRSTSWSLFPSFKLTFKSKLSNTFDWIEITIFMAHVQHHLRDIWPPRLEKLHSSRSYIRRHLKRFVLNRINDTRYDRLIKLHLYHLLRFRVKN